MLVGYGIQKQSNFPCLTSIPFKPRAQLYIFLTKEHDIPWSRIIKSKRKEVRVSIIQSLKELLSSTVVVTTSQKTNSNISNKSQGRYQVGIIRELDKKFLLYSYTIYMKSSWSMLMINSPTLIFMCNSCFHHVSTSYFL